MAGKRVWVRGDLPFLRSGPMWRIHEAALPALDAMLERHGYVRIELDGRRMTSRAAAHAVLGEAFGFPEWYGGNWDAFHDCFYGFAAAHEGRRVAVLWRHLDEAAAAPATLAEVGWALLECATGHWPTPDPSPPTTMQLDLFAIGTGDDFDRPRTPMTLPPDAGGSTGRPCCAKMGGPSTRSAPPQEPAR